MFFFNEKFEYLIHNMLDPSNQDFTNLDYDDEEYKRLEWYKIYYNMMLNELGAVGWELIMRFDDSYKSDDKVNQTVNKLIFKRSSRSKYYKTGSGIDMRLISELAKEQADSEHINFSDKNEK